MEVFHVRSGSVRRLLACFLAMTIVSSCVPLRTLASGDLPTGESMPEESTSGESIPEESVPEETVPGESVPEESTSVESMPEGSASGESTPEESTSGESMPEGSASEESLPEGSTNEASTPDESASEESTPEGSASEGIPSGSPPEGSLPEDTLPAVVSEPEGPAGPGLYFGLLGAHSGLSEGTGTVDALFQSAAGIPGLDFFAVTDHSDSLDNHNTADIRTDATALSADWAAGKAAAAAATAPAFVGLFGYEMNWPSRMQLGHISTFGTPGFQSRTQDAYREHDSALENYYAALASVPGGVSQFDHPGTQYGSFHDFQPYSAQADQVISLLKLDFGEKDPLRYYTQALDRGWHLAPTAGQSIYGPDWTDTGVRTAVHAQALTEQGILDALKNGRAYATEDPDLEISYSMDGCPMGSRLALRHTGQRADLSVTLYDPTDGAACTVEVITNGSAVAAKQTLSGASGILSFSLPAASGYYFLLITQPDGHRAVTAPIWLDAEEDLGIASFSCDTAVPVRNEPVTLNTALYNRETADLLVGSLEILADGLAVASDDSLTRIPANSTLSHPLTFSFDCAGSTEITVRLSGTLEGSKRSYEASLTLNFRQSEQVTGIAADAGHGNAGLDALNILNTMALDAHIRFQPLDRITSDSLKNCRFLLVTAPSEPFSEEFLAAAREFAGWGGNIILCGQDEDPSGSEELNRLLSCLGSTLRITADPVRDTVNNSGGPGNISTDRFNPGLSWCGSISDGQMYRADSACAVDPGLGDWIVKAYPTAGNGEEVLLACEALSGGGTIFAAGSLFLSDEYLARSQTIWGEPYTNRTLAENLLGIGGEPVPLSTIAQARNGTDGQLFRIRGYVTAGTSNPCNSFPDTLYLQDDTGGIAVMPFSGGDIQQGTPVEITGYAGTAGRNRILNAGSWRILEGDLYQYAPLDESWDTLLDMDQNGGRLVQVEGICREIYCREDNTLAGCLLEDPYGNTAIVKIETFIKNGSDGENDLHETIRKYRTVRAVGLLHTDDYGNTVVRVRNCGEVVWVPPRYYWNPRTGDFLLPGYSAAMTLSALGLLLLKKRKRQ